MKKIIKIANGKNKEAISAIGRLDQAKDWKITIEEWDYKRSIDQNRRYWELLTEIGNNLGYKPDEMHALMAYKYLSYKDEVLNEEITVIPSTTSLTIKEFNTYMSNVENFGTTVGVKFIGN